MSNTVKKWKEDNQHHSALQQTLQLVQSIDLPSFTTTFADQLKTMSGAMVQVQTLFEQYCVLQKPCSDQFKTHNDASLSIVNNFVRGLLPKFHHMFVKFLIEEWNLPQLLKQMHIVVTEFKSEDHSSLIEGLKAVVATPAKIVGKPFHNIWPKLMPIDDARDMQGLPDMVHAWVKKLAGFAPFLIHLCDPAHESPVYLRGLRYVH
jgi:hypothetical protein